MKLLPVTFFCRAQGRHELTLSDLNWEVLLSLLYIQQLDLSTSCFSIQWYIYVRVLHLWCIKCQKRHIHISYLRLRPSGCKHLFHGQGCHVCNDFSLHNSIKKSRLLPADGRSIHTYTELSMACVRLTWTAVTVEKSIWPQLVFMFMKTYNRRQN